MILASLCVILAQPKELRILFLGNSHTATHDVPGMVRHLIETPSKQVKTHFVFGAYLNDLDTPTNRKLISDGKWDVVVFQAAKVSSSHKYTYSQAGGINLAKLAKASGARTYLFVEWPRRGWNESDLQMAVYKRIAAATGAKPIPICYAWDAALKRWPSLDMWAADGNHSALPGAYLAACSISYAISSGANPWSPRGLGAGLAKNLRGVARETWEGWKSQL